VTSPLYEKYLAIAKGLRPRETYKGDEGVYLERTDYGRWISREWALREVVRGQLDESWGGITMHRTPEAAAKNAVTISNRAAKAALARARENPKLSQRTVEGRKTTFYGKVPMRDVAAAKRT